MKQCFLKTYYRIRKEPHEGGLDVCLISKAKSPLKGAKHSSRGNYTLPLVCLKMKHIKGIQLFKLM